ncbi:MAG: chromate efflux transporter [Alphaproteobacteria bacterium]|nr:chromate efflux transporter [Alphaproteobacteria bacterium]MBN9558430.1 chromate efflux transporter [Alphaproteobacteria bacterium]MBN9567360.1 chromate efflux transporter [Alphaproteobacteria bacterium]OJU55431.1 MAG: chromate transporter [Alphaproteobacteria bacterium 62-8]
MPTELSTSDISTATFCEGAAVRLPTLSEAFWTWARVAILSFGGPAGQIAVMHRILVEEKRWIGEQRFLHALNYCMLLPGPEAHELAIYIGWLLHRVWGGLVAGILFVLPGLISLSVLSCIYVIYGNVGIAQALFLGLKAAVLAVVLEAVVRVGKRALKSNGLITVAALAFIGIYFFALPFPLIVLSAALIGYAGSAAGLMFFRATDHGPVKGDAQPALIDKAFAREVPPHVRPSLSRFIKVAVIGAVVWLGPLVVLLYRYGPDDVFTSIAMFNSKMAVVTFGGAYAVLAYMAQQAVELYHWLKPGEMLVGLGFAETTPGPLISVVQFVGFMAAYRQPGPLDPIVAGLLGGVLAKWCTFVPPFLWIFLGGPYIEALIGNKSLNAALSAITAAVVGVILNLSIWFSFHALFARVPEIQGFGMSFAVPDITSIHWPTLVLAVAAIIAIFRFKIGMIPVFGASSLAGGAYYLVTGLT